MSNMHTFHRQLHSSFAEGDTYQRSLARLTDAGLVQMAALKSDLSWDTWPSRSEPQAA
jgi:hypothetical protein